MKVVQIHDETESALAIAGVVIGVFCIYQVLRFFKYLTSFPAEYYYALAAGIMLTFGLLLFIRHKIIRLRMKEVEKDAEEIIRNHLTALCDNFTSLVKADEFGHIDFTPWYDRVRDVVKNRIGSKELNSLLSKHPRYLSYFLDIVTAKVLDKIEQS